MRRKPWLRASVPKVAIRNELPWRIKALLLLGLVSVVSVVVAAILLTYVTNRPEPPQDDGALTAELSRLRSESKQAVQERDRQSALAVRLESQLKVDQAAHEQVHAQLRALENENARLKEDLAFFESLLPTPANAKGVVIRSFRLQPVNETEQDKRRPDTKGTNETQALRYRLLVQQSGRPDRDFVGAVSLTVSLQRDGRPWVLQLPDSAQPEAGPAPLSFRHYQRVEGTFELPEGAVVRSVQVKIQSGGEVRAQQTFTM